MCEVVSNRRGCECCELPNRVNRSNPQCDNAQSPDLAAADRGDYRRHMDIAVLGTGNVGRTLTHALRDLDHTVVVGSRTGDNSAALEWTAAVGASLATFADAAAASELIINATAGVASLAALGSIAPDALAGKVIIDLANSLDFSQGFPPTLAVCNDDSLGEQIQREFPEALVVKALNTMNCELMVSPASVPGDHVVFIAGNDDSAKVTTTALLGEFGWATDNVIDLGDISAARGTEMYLPLWLRLMQSVGHANFNINLVVGPPS